jgi:uncharacterized protein
MELKIQKGSITPGGNFEGIYATGERDRDNEVVMPEAADDQIGKRVPLLFAHHEPCGSVVIQKGGKCLGRFNLGCTAGREAYALAVAGDVTGLSLGGIVRKHSMRNGVRFIERVEILEISFVSVPAIQSAGITAIKSLGERVADAIRGKTHMEQIGAYVPGSILKAAGDPIYSTNPKAASRVDSELSARTPSWVARLRRVEVPTGAVLSGRVQGYEGDVAPQTEGQAKSPVRIRFADENVNLPSHAGVIYCSKQLLDDAPNFAALVDAFLAERIMRRVEARAAVDLSALDPTPEADGFTAMGLLADDGFAPSIVLMPATKVFAYAKASTNSDAAPRIAGVPVLPCAGLTVGLALAEAALSFVERQGIAIEVGFADDDLSRNMRHVVGEARSIVDYNDVRAVRSFTLPA